jgi:uncharacterized protein (DUF433 family)
MASKKKIVPNETDEPVALLPSGPNPSDPQAAVVSKGGVCGGVPCIRGTRIPVWVLANYRRMGMSDVEILEQYPSLSQVNLDAAWNYFLGHTAEIEEQIRENME